MYDDKGKIYFVKLSDFINYRSIKLSSAEIKDILEMHPSILKAAIVPVPHETYHGYRTTQWYLFKK